jgi:hypothetical protein
MLPLAEQFLATHRVYGYEYPTQFEAENLDPSYSEVLSKSLTEAFRKAAEE